MRSNLSMAQIWRLWLAALALLTCASCDTGQPAALQSTAPTPLPCGVWQTKVTTGDGDEAGQLSAILAFSASDVWAEGSATPFDWRQSALHHWDGNKWKVMPAADFKPYAELQALAGTSDEDIWAVGSSDSGLTSQTLIAHWNKDGLTQIPSPNPGAKGNYLNGVAVAASNDVWAVGAYQGNDEVNQPLILHWDGHSWSLTQTPHLNAAQAWLAGVTALSSTDIWAVGEYSDNKEHNGSDWWPLVLHWDGTAWQQITIPNPVKGVLLDSVSALSATDIWAVGEYEYNSGAVMHWDGKIWTTNYGSSVANGRLYGVIALPDANIWAAGYRMEGPWRIPIVVHLQNGKWIQLNSPKPTAETGFSGIADDHNGGIWLAGMAFKGEEDAPIYGLILHTSGTYCSDLATPTLKP